MNPLTNKIKAALLDFYIFQRSAKLACTELWDGFSIADFIAIMKSNNIIEVEIKISVSDLHNELKKSKERYNWEMKNGIYEKVNIQNINKHHILDTTTYYITPNKYYFCVPEYMLDKTLEFSKKLNPKYGVIVYKENTYISKSLKFVKRATNLHDEKFDTKYERKMIDRICNDLTKKYRLLYCKKN